MGILNRDKISSRDEWAARIAALDVPTPQRREPITQVRIVDAALGIVASEGFDALTMRRIASELQTSASALYVHVRDKAALDELLIGALCAAVVLPTPDPSVWEEQAMDVLRQLRDQYLRYPGIARAAFAGAPQSLDTQRIFEGLFGILLTGGLSPQRAAWTIDAAFLYVGAHSLVAVRRSGGLDSSGRIVDRNELTERLRMLPTDRFPNSVVHADALTSGHGDDRFDFAIWQLLDPTAHAGADRSGR